jgi:hypothetical protein
MVPYKETMVGFGTAVVGLLVLGGDKQYTSINGQIDVRRDRHSLALNVQNLMKKHNNQPAFGDRVIVWRLRR